MDRSDCQATRQGQGLCAYPKALGCRADFRMARAKQTPRKGFRTNHRKRNGMALYRFHSNDDEAYRSELISNGNFMSQTLSQRMEIDRLC